MPGRLTRLGTLNTASTEKDPRPRLRPRGLPPALEPHGVYSALNPADAAMYGTDLLGTHRVHLEGNPDGFGATFHAVLFRDVTLGYLDYEGDVRVEVAQLPAHHLVLTPATGTSRIDNQGRSADLTTVLAAVPTPGTTMTLAIPAESAHLVVRIERDALAVHLARLLGHGLEQEVGFDLAFDLSSSAASRWNFAVQMLHAELYDPESLLHTGVGVGAMEEYLMSALLYALPSSYHDALTRTGPSQRRAVRAAVDYIEAHLALDISVGDVADAAGIGIRTLQKQFREDVGQSPLAFMRDRRLERARADLADAAPGPGVSVTDIALRWQFNHLGRFSSSYKARFGESPSATLRS